MEWRSHLFAALRHPAEPRILFLRSDREWRLPHILVRDAVWVADAQVAVTAFERRLGTRPWLLRQIASDEDDDAKRIHTVYELALLDDEWRPPAHGRWVSRGELDGLRLKDDHRGLLDPYLDALERGEIPVERSPWARRGWLENVRTWLERELERIGHRLAALEQVKHWSISSVLRVLTDGPDFYFKVPARLPLFVEEATLTARLAERFPGYIPVPLAVDAARGWMLLPEFGELFGWKEPLAFRQELFRRFAGLQRRSATVADGLLADGCLDRRLDVLAAQLDPLLEAPGAVARLAPDEVDELRRLAPLLKELCARLAACGLPDTLVHGDLHPGNVARINGELAYFDWTDACVAHPFMDLHSLQWERDESMRTALVAAYLEAWEGVESPARLHEAVRLAAAVTPLHHAVSYHQIVAGLEPAARPELDATHTFLREALARAKEVL